MKKMSTENCKLPLTPVCKYRDSILNRDSIGDCYIPLSVPEEDFDNLIYTAGESILKEFEKDKFSDKEIISKLLEKIDELDSLKTSYQAEVDKLKTKVSNLELKTRVVDSLKELFNIIKNV